MVELTEEEKRILSDYLKATYGSDIGIDFSINDIMIEKGDIKTIGAIKGRKVEEIKELIKQRIIMAIYDGVEINKRKIRITDFIGMNEDEEILKVIVKTVLIENLYKLDIVESVEYINVEINSDSMYIEVTIKTITVDSVSLRMEVIK